MAEIYVRFCSRGQIYHQMWKQDKQLSAIETGKMSAIKSGYAFVAEAVQIFVVVTRLMSTIATGHSSCFNRSHSLLRERADSCPLSTIQIEEVSDRGVGLKISVFMQKCQATYV